MGGWDTSESVADMPEDRAVFLDNWFPETDKVTVRRGSEVHSTGLTGMVETLIEYTALSGAGKLFAANNGSIYEVTSGGAVGSAVSTGHTNNRWQYVNMGTAGGQFVRLVNGADTPLLYNGSTWATTAITGPTAANLVWCNVHQRRLWVGEEDSLSAWYLAVNNVSGAATEFPLAGIFRLGGFIMAMGTWTRDAGDGMDDVAVFLTSEGECAIYSGTDPSDAALWLLVGVFRIGKPIGRRCFVSAGSDLIIVTQDGFVPLSAILTLDRAQAQRAAYRNKYLKLSMMQSVFIRGFLVGNQFYIPKVFSSSSTSHFRAFYLISMCLIQSPGHRVVLLVWMRFVSGFLMMIYITVVATGVFINGILDRVIPQPASPRISPPMDLRRFLTLDLKGGINHLKKLSPYLKAVDLLTLPSILIWIFRSYLHRALLPSLLPVPARLYGGQVNGALPNGAQGKLFILDGGELEELVEPPLFVSGYRRRPYGLRGWRPTSSSSLAVICNADLQRGYCHQSLGTESYTSRYKWLRSMYSYWLCRLRQQAHSRVRV